MIIKVRTSNINAHLEGLGATMSWRFYDGVQGLHYSKYASENNFRIEASKWATPPDVQEIWICEPTPVDDEVLYCSFHSEATGPMQ